MTSSPTRGASAASFSPRLRQSAVAAPEAIPCQVTGGLGGTAPASSHFPMVSESGRTGSAPTVSRTATASRHAARKWRSLRTAGSEAPVTSGTSSGGCGQTAAAISIWSSRKGYLTCQNSALRPAVTVGDRDPHGRARAEAAGPGSAAALVLLVLVSVCFQVQLHEHRMHGGPLTSALRPSASRSVPLGQKYVLLGKTPGGRQTHRLCEDGAMDAEDLRLAVYRAFAETGRAPRSDELGRQLGAGAQEV